MNMATLMSVQHRRPEWTLENERKRHNRAVRAVMRSMQAGECEQDTGLEAIGTLIDWYEATNMSIDRAIPAWLRDRKET